MQTPFHWSRLDVPNSRSECSIYYASYVPITSPLART
jgi:hypothetical protein